MSPEASVAAREGWSAGHSGLASSLRKQVAMTGRMVNIPDAEGYMEQHHSPEQPGQICATPTPETMVWCKDFMERQAGGDDFHNN